MIDLAFSPDGCFLASCDFAGDVIIWDVKSGSVRQHIRSAHSAAAKGVAWDPMNRYVATQVRSLFFALFMGVTESRYRE